MVKLIVVEGEKSTEESKKADIKEKDVSIDNSIFNAKA